VPTRVEHSGQRHNWWSNETVYNIIGAALFLIDVQMELFQIHEPFLMAIVYVYICVLLCSCISLNHSNKITSTYQIPTYHVLCLSGPNLVCVTYLLVVSCKSYGLNSIVFFHCIFSLRIFTSKLVKDRRIR